MVFLAHARGDIMDKNDAASDCGCMQHAAHPRRSFLKLAAFGAGAALMSAGLPMASASASGQAEVLLLSCMDYRLLDEIARYMDGRGLTNKYDHVILAGASLGALVDAKPEWGATFWNHVEVAKDLHHINKVMIIDHRDCGAYKVFIGPDTAKDKETETRFHTEQLQKLAAALAKRYPQFGVELLLMSLDGTVEPVTLPA
jgi:hypothetical protein